MWWLTLVAALVLGCDAETQQEQPVPEKRPGFSAPASTPGRWNEAPGPSADSDLTPEQMRQIEALRAIGYVDGSVAAPDFEGVVRHEGARSQSGFNFYVSGHDTEAILMDMAGRVVHRWRLDFAGSFPERSSQSPLESMQFWRRAHLYPNGDLLAIFDGFGLIRVDKNSKLLWASPEAAHHDLQVTADGDIYVLTREAHVVARVHPKRPILEDFISVLSPDGVVKTRLSLLEAFENAAPKADWLVASKRFWAKERTRKLAANPSDIFHTNGLTVLDGSLAKRHEAFAAGNVLVSLCHLDTIAIVDMDQRRVVWTLEGRSTLQHDATITARGGLLFFDNHQVPMSRSSATELDPVTLETIWQYPGELDDPFFSRTCGTAQRLENGNTLITESDAGRAIEVTPDRQIVWEFYNPHRAGPQDEYIATLFEVIRLPADFPVDWSDGAMK